MKLRKFDPIKAAPVAVTVVCLALALVVLTGCGTGRSTGDPSPAPPPSSPSVVGSPGVTSVARLVAWTRSTSKILTASRSALGFCPTVPDEASEAAMIDCSAVAVAAALDAGTALVGQPDPGGIDISIVHGALTDLNRIVDTDLDPGRSCAPGREVTSGCVAAVLRTRLLINVALTDLDALAEEASGM
ncbi:MAG: hypothetical protein PVJ28_00155 [Acidimicrobiia bacterium]|jgi:hypothetical protein